MKHIMMTVTEAKAFFEELDCALDSVALGDFVETTGITDRDLRSLAEIIREQALLAEERRLKAGRKAKAAKITPLPKA